MSVNLVALLPILVLAATPVVLLLVIAVRRSHVAAAWLTLAGLALAFVLLPVAASAAGPVTTLLAIDGYALFFTGLLLLAAFVVTALSYHYLRGAHWRNEEYYVLLLLATFGGVVLVASTHFASFFLGLEVLSVSLYALIAYSRSERGVEAGVKYLVLAAASSAFLLFGMALVYAQTGTMEFAKLNVLRNSSAPLGVTGLAMMVVGIGFKLAVVPFHLWTPDVYQGAAAPVTAFVATVSKGAMMALLLRLFNAIDIHTQPAIVLIFAIIAILSMLVGNLLALLQTNVKRILAYSSIAHLGYMLVAFMAGGANAVIAVGFYLVAYFITTLGAFGVVTVLSLPSVEAEALEDYRGLFWQRPWLAGLFTAMLLSLAGIPLTAGFLGKFFVFVAGAGALLWLQLIVLAVASTIGLYYYLRVVVVMYSRPAAGVPAATPRPAPSLSWASAAVLVVLGVLLILFGVFPAPLITLIRAAAG